MARERLLTHHKRKVLRKRITLAETLFGAGFILCVALATAWIAAQGDNFDPADRDVSFETLERQSVDDILYTPPLKRWTEPGTAPALAGLPDLSPFPAGILEGGWELDGRVETYDESNVYEKINGAAEQYRSFGFKALHYVTLAQGAEFLNIELYDQGEFKNVLGIFSAQRAEGREVRTRGEVYWYETPVGVIGGYRNIYFKVAGSSEAEQILDKARSFVDLVPSLAAAGAPPPRSFTLLTRDLGIGFDSIEYVRQDVFQYEFLTDFWFGALPDGKEERLFLHEAPDGASAEAIYARLVAEQKNEYAVVEESDGRALLKHEFLETFFAVRRSGAVIYGVEGAATRGSAESALGRLAEALSVD